MKNLSIFDNIELSKSELKKIDGGFIGQLIVAVVAGSITAVSFGYNLGKDLYHIIND